MLSKRRPLARPLRMANGRFDLALEVGGIRAAWQSDDAVVVEQLGEERIECRIVDVWLQYAFFEIIEANRTRGAAEVRKRLFVQLAPDLAR